MNNSTTKSAIELALDDLKLQKKPNYSATARKFGVERTTLAKRFKGKTVSRAIANSEHQQHLTMDQEKVLVEYINKLTDRGMPHIVRNLVEEMIQSLVGRNWPAKFVQCHKTELKSLYLRNIDSMRKKAEYKPSFQMFYKQVSFLSSCILRILANITNLIIVTICNRNLSHYS